MTTMPVYEMVDTWNAAGTVFTAIGMNVTDNLSASGSMLIDLQVGGTSQFHVTKSGSIHGKRANFNIASANAPIVSVSNYSLTGSNADSLFDLAGTWNTSGTPTALKLNVTDTASAAGSLLLDLQVGGSSRFRVAKDGAFSATGAISVWTGTAVGAGNQVIHLNPSSQMIAVASTGQFSFGATTNAGSTQDVILVRDAADTLAQRRGTNAQAFRIYNTFTDASNYERGIFRWISNFLEIGTEAAGTGSARAILLSTGGATRWNIGTAGHLTAGADNTYDIGASGANRPRNVFIAGGVTAGTSLECGSGDGFVIASRAIIRSYANGTIQISNAASNDFNRLQFGGTTSSFPALKRNATAINVRLADDSADAPLTAGRITAQTLTIGLGGQTAVANNTALGFEALNSASLTGTANVGVGYYSLRANTTGNNNTAVGYGPLYNNTTGSGNSAVGEGALESNTTGVNNTAMARTALLNNTTGASNSAVGMAALRNFNTSNNTAIGFEAAAGSATVANNTGSNLTAVGYQALRSNTSGDNNSAVGANALNSNTTGSNNSAVGRSALESNTTGGNNNAIGFNALYSNTTGVNNSAAGTYALFSNTTGNHNSAVGTSALYYFNTSNNTAIGYEAARGSATVANNTGSNLTAVGYQALLSNTSGGSNSAVGQGALQNNTTGNRNSALGVGALRELTTGNDNAALGRLCLALVTTGSDNTGIGEEAGDVITTGARNTIVGANSDPSANNGNDQTVIGEGLTGKGDDTFFCGGTNGAYNEKNVTTWETTSDARIKKNIVSNGVGLEVISQIDVRNFEYRTPEEITEVPQSAAINQPGVQLGVIAQELQAVLPECVTENSTGVLSVNTDPLVWYLVNAVKQLSAEVKTLKGE